MGLKHARAVARAAGGDLELVSDAGSSGACFRLRWPRSSRRSPGAPVSSPRPAVLAGTRVLVVEDDVDVAMLLESALGARGADVVVARTAAELAERAGETGTTPRSSTCRPSPTTSRAPSRCSAEGRPSVAIVFISGSSARLPDEVEEEGVRWVRKPFEVGEIVAALTTTRDAPNAARVYSSSRPPRSSDPV